MAEHTHTHKILINNISDKLLKWKHEYIRIYRKNKVWAKKEWKNHDNKYESTGLKLKPTEKKQFK